MNQNLQPLRPTRILGIAILIFMATFIVRLFIIQIVQHDQYQTLADKGQKRQWNLPAERGELWMMNGDTPTRVVLNEAVYTAWVDPSVVTGESKGKIITTFEKIAGGNVRSNYKELLDKKDTRYQVLATKLSYKQAQLIKQEKLYGVGFEKGVQRVYPEGQLGSQVLGFVNNEGIGQYGIEGKLNDRLHGKDGMLRTVADVRNVPLTVGKDSVNIPAVNGENIVLTIDRTVQAKLEKTLAEHTKKIGAPRASAIVMNPNNGHVLAMANVPTYDPNDIGKLKDINVLNNATITTPIEPGSVMKTFTVASGLDMGVITPETRYNNTDSVRVGDRTIVNASKGQTGSITLQTALDWSLNTGMVYILGQMGGGAINDQARMKMYEYFHDKFRLGQKTGIELSGESAGIVIAPTNTDGNAVRYSNMSFGQGMNLTMMQVASGFSALLNGGQYIQPTVVAGKMEGGEYKPSTEHQKTEQILSETAAKQAMQMVHGARNRFYKATDPEGYYIGGKTGTSQVLKKGEYVFDETVATYLGYGGEIDKKPQYVIMVQVSGDNMNLQGSTHAMPVFNEMSNWMIEHLKLQPKR